MTYHRFQQPKRVTFEKANTLIYDVLAFFMPKID